MAINALKKLTSRDIMKGKPDMEIVKVNVPNASDPKKTEEKQFNVAKPADLYVFYGRAHQHRTGTTALGDFIEYIGQFEARRLKDGEVFQSTRLIAPPIAADMIEQAYMVAKKDDQNAVIDLGFVIGVEADFSGALGYKYTCKPLNAGAQTHDPLADLRGKMTPQITAIIGAETVALIGMTPATADGEVIETPEPAKSKKTETA